MKRFNLEKDMWTRVADWPNATNLPISYYHDTAEKFKYATSLNLYPAILKSRTAPTLIPFEYIYPYGVYQVYINNL